MDRATVQASPSGRLLPALVIAIGVAIALAGWSLHQYRETSQLKSSPYAQSGYTARADVRYISAGDGHVIMPMAVSGCDLGRLWLVFGAWEGADESAKPIGPVYAFRLDYDHDDFAMPGKFQVRSAVFERRKVLDKDGALIGLDAFMNGELVLSLRGKKGVDSLVDPGYSQTITADLRGNEVFEQVLSDSFTFGDDQKRIVRYRVCLTTEKLFGEVTGLEQRVQKR